MNKSLAIARLAVQLSEVTTTERALGMIQRALRSSGLSHVTTLTNGDLNELLSALAAEGGVAQIIAEQLAIDGLDESFGPTAA